MSRRDLPPPGTEAPAYLERSFPRRYYRTHAPSQIRDLAPLPSTLALEIVASAWNADGLNPQSETTTLALLTPQTFSVFLGHTLHFSAIIRDRLVKAITPPKKSAFDEDDADHPPLF